MSFPFFTHRTMKEAAETEELLAANLRGSLRSGQWRNLDALLQKEEVNNPCPQPPPDPKPDNAA